MNHKLERRFEAARAKLEELGCPAKNEVMAFHGTPEANFESYVLQSLESPIKMLLSIVGS